MCNRHIAHIIADYEAARLDEAEGEGGDSGDDDSTAPAPADETATPSTGDARPGVLARVAARLGR